MADRAITFGSYTEQLKRRYDALKTSTERTNCEGHWQQIAEMISPRKLDFVGMRTPGEKRMNQVYDTTGIHANELLAAGLHGMATNPASKWFSLRIVGKKAVEDGTRIDLNELPEVQKYLSDVEDIMWARIYQPGTNFTTSLHETYLDLGAFGTAVMFLGQRDNGGLLFEPRALAECIVAENHEGRIDTVFRRTKYTVRQMMQMSKHALNPDGWDVSQKVKDLYKKQKYDEPIYVIHAVFPRAERDPTKKGTKDMPWASCYFEETECHELEMGGFPEFPYLVPRWSKYAGEVYGRSPGMTSLPDVKMLQAMTVTVIKAAQKIVDPPLWLRDDGVVGQTRTVPGGINYWRGNPNDGVMLQPVAGQALPITLEMLEALRNRIRTTFFTDVLQITTDAEMTATEVMQRTAERMRLMGPLIGRLEAEMLGPLVDRVFGILNRANLLPPPPEIIQDEEFTVEYVSPIATAQKQMTAAGMTQVMQLMFGLFGEEGAGMLAMRKLDADKTFSWAWDLFNNDPDLLKDDEQLAVENQRQQMQQGVQIGQPAMDMVNKGATSVKSLADAQANGGLDFQAIMAALQQAAKDNPQALRGIQGQMPPAMIEGANGAAPQ